MMNTNVEENGQVVEQELQESQENLEAVENTPSFGDRFSQIGQDPDETNQEETNQEEGTEEETITSEDESISSEDPGSKKAESETTEKAKPAAEGVSGTMKLLARQSGIADALIETAVNDKQLEAWIGLMSNQAPEKQEEEKPEDDPYAVALPEGEFPEDDPVRAEFSKLHEHFGKQLEQYRDYLSEMANVVVDLREQRDQEQATTFNQQQNKFDTILDGYENETLGSREELSSTSGRVRAAVFDEYLELKKTSPSVSDDELVHKAMSTFGFHNPKEKREEAYRQANTKRLGGGPSKPSAETDESKFALAMKRINERKK